MWIVSGGNETSEQLSTNIYTKLNKSKTYNSNVIHNLTPRATNTQYSDTKYL